MLGDLNELSAMACDVGNAYLYAATKEKVYAIAGKEFWELQGQISTIQQALYGLQTSGARFHDHLSDTLHDLGFVPSKAARDLWHRDFNDHYENLAFYVDDVMVWAKNPIDVINALKKTSIPWKMSGCYQGRRNFTLEETSRQWMTKLLWELKPMSNASSQKNWRINWYNDPDLFYSNGHRQSCGSRQITYVGWWENIAVPNVNRMCNVGDHPRKRWHPVYDVCLARFSTLPRENYFRSALRILGYLKGKPNGVITIDGGEPGVFGFQFCNEDWSEVYPGAMEKIPDDMPPLKGNPVVITTYSTRIMRET